MGVGAMRCDILVVEDDPLLRMTVAEGLRDAGFAVEEAACGSDALTMLRGFKRHQAAPRVLVADIDLGPGPDGLEVGAEAMEMLPELQVVYSSGRPSSMAGHPLGARECSMPKPYDPARLAALVHRLID